MKEKTKCLIGNKIKEKQRLYLDQALVAKLEGLAWLCGFELDHQIKERYNSVKGKVRNTQ